MEEKKAADPKPKKSGSFWPFRFVILGILLAGILAVGLIIGMAASDIPDFEQIENPTTELSTQLHTGSNPKLSFVFGRLGLSHWSSLVGWEFRVKFVEGRRFEKFCPLYGKGEVMECRFLKHL